MSSDVCQKDADGWLCSLETFVELLNNHPAAAFLFGLFLGMLLSKFGEISEIFVIWFRKFTLGDRRHPR